MIAPAATGLANDAFATQNFFTQETFFFFTMTRTKPYVRVESLGVSTGLVNQCTFFSSRGRLSERVFLIVEVCHYLFSSSHLLDSAHPQIFSSSHFLKFSHPQMFSHLLIFTSSYIFSSSHLLIFTSSPIFSSSYFLICTTSYIFSSSYSHIFSLLPCCPLALLPSSLFSISSKARGSANEAPRNATLSHEMRVDRQKLG